MPLSEEIKKRMEIVRAAVNNSPYYLHLGMALVAFDEGKARFEMTVKRHHTNIYGAAHGGAIASIADSACGLAVATRLVAGQSTVTLDLRVNYCASVKEGLLVAEGEVVYMGKTTAVETAKITQNGNLVAFAVATHYIKQSAPPIPNG